MLIFVGIFGEGWQIEGVLERIGDHRCLGICRRDETLCNEMIMERRALPFEKGIEVCRRKRDKDLPSRIWMLSGFASLDATEPRICRVWSLIAGDRPAALT
jgi:hypothetical protein